MCKLTPGFKGGEVMLTNAEVTQCLCDRDQGQIINSYRPTRGNNSVTQTKEGSLFQQGAIINSLSRSVAVPGGD